MQNIETQTGSLPAAKQTDYRPDIDGLRALAVIVVVFFHSGTPLFSGGYIGVDIFFVISGYLITSVIQRGVEQRNFSYITFLYRRIARLSPALLITLVIVAIGGFIFLDDSGYDSMGKRLLFASLGLANIYYAAGVDYFTPDAVADPLIHLWSLGVEEQFYLVWPITLVLLLKIGNKTTTIITVAVAVLSVILSNNMLATDPVSAYYLPQYRCFELLIGALAWQFHRSTYNRINPNSSTSGILAILGMATLAVCSITYSDQTAFPGIAALLPCIATAIVILCAPQNVVGRALANKTLVLLGVISYPLYLFHQPAIAILTRSGLLDDGWQLAFAVLAITAPCAYLVYRFVETPIRRSVKHGLSKEKKNTVKVNSNTADSLKASYVSRILNKAPPLMVIGLVASLLSTGATGVYIALNEGIPERFQWFNPFAAEMLHNQRRTFKDHFVIGFEIQESPISDLYVGDSLMQHYIVPSSVSQGSVMEDQISTATLGGCVLLKSVVFRNQFVLNSCDDVRESIYNHKQQFRSVFISQSWESYEGDILNASELTDGEFGTLERWRPFLLETIEHFKPLADNIYIIGGHPKVGPAAVLQPNLLSERSSYVASLETLKVTNWDHLEVSRRFFNDISSQAGVHVIHPEDLWCESADSGVNTNNAVKTSACRLHDGQWSYFGDTVHAAAQASPFLIENFRPLLLNSEQ